METRDFQKDYSESKLWSKIGDFAGKAGIEMITQVLKLYYAMALGKATPAQITAIVAALGYFISPLDVVADPLPGGLVDDAGVLSLAISTLTCCNTPEVSNAAKAKAKEWFG